MEGFMWELLTGNSSTVYDKLSCPVQGLVSSFTSQKSTFLCFKDDNHASLYNEFTAQFRRSFFWEVQELREGFVEIFQLNLAELTTEVDLFLSEALSSHVEIVDSLVDVYKNILVDIVAWWWYIMTLDSWCVWQMCVLTIPQLRHQERVLHPSLLQLSPDFGSVKTSVATLEVRFSGLMRRCWVYDLRWFMYMFTSTWFFLGLIRTHIVYMAPCGNWNTFCQGPGRRVGCPGWAVLSCVQLAE